MRSGELPPAGTISHFKGWTLAEGIGEIQNLQLIAGL